MNTSKRKVLITGVNGYIGSHLAKVIKDYHSDTIIADGFGLYSNDENKVKDYLRDYRQDNILSDSTFWYYDKKKYDCVVHLAGLISVSDSVLYPTKYFNTNVVGTKNILENMRMNNLIFASTAAAFDPISPYALSKVMAEKIIREKSRRSNYTIFRFFNVAGSDGVNRQIGSPTHLIRIAAETAAGKRDLMTINGTDWPTHDGTCVRDYIHVLDLVDSIIKAIYNPKNTDYECLGTGTTYSCREVIDTMKQVTGVDFKVTEGPRRSGDVATLTMDHKSDYATCKRSLADMCRSAYEVELTRA